MLQSLFANDFLIMAVLVFVAVMLLLESAYIAWRSQHGPQARRFKSRLNTLSGVRIAGEPGQLLKQPLASELPLFERRLLGFASVRGLDRMMEQSGLGWSRSRLLVMSALMGLAGWFVVAALLRQTPLTGVFAGVVLGCLPLLYVHFMREKRMRKIESQLPDAMDLMTRALRAGHAFPSGLKMAGDEMAEPIAGELRAVHDEVNYGVSMEQALTHLSERVPLTDLRYFVVAVLIQRDSGGNLTELLSNLSRLLRERAKLIAKVRVLSSEGRLSGWVLVVMPFALAGILNLMNPKFMSLMWTDPIGLTMIKYLLVMMAMGIVVMRKVVKIRY